MEIPSPVLRALAKQNEPPSIELCKFVNFLQAFQDRRILAVKSTNHFHAAFSAISSRILYADADSTYIPDPRRIFYTKLKRKVWPIVDNPFTELS
jgi:microcystin degradation protein MlrC